MGINPIGNTGWMNDFALSVNSETPSIAGYILLGIWLVGIFAMIILVIKSSLRLRSLEKSALPLQNPEVRRLYQHCLEEMGIHRKIPVYSTAFLKSPIIVRLLKPCIYLPIHLIINIVSYEKPTFIKRIKGMTAFLLTAVVLMGFAPFISTYAADVSHYQWDSSSENVSYIDLSTYFGEYEGSFVLYDSENDTWSIHDIEHATLRVAPNSTYKIYDALFGLEEGVITPENSFIAWNGETYPFEAWNADQTLQSAMNSSVNWYFQTVDEQLGASDVYSYVQKIGYGNENMSGDFSSYWMESSLEISPIEQVELLTKLQNNSFGFAPENINAVKDAIRLSSSDTGTLYGKTGTGRVNGQDVNGWFIGYIETADNTYFFATNISADSDATGGNATEITMSILSDMNIWVSQK